MTGGLTTETGARLSGLGLLSEHPVPPTGARGRPTTALGPHPRGPLVVAVVIGHETWRIAVGQLGGTELAHTQRPHQRDPGEVLTGLAARPRSPPMRAARPIPAAARSGPP